MNMTKEISDALCSDPPNLIQMHKEGGNATPKHVKPVQLEQRPQFLVTETDVMTERRKAYLHQYKALWGDYYEREFNSNPAQYLIYDWEKPVLEYVEQKNQLNGEYLWVVINPDPKLLDPTTLKGTIVDRITKTLSKCFVAEYICSVEQTGTLQANLGQHPHINMLIQKLPEYKSKKPSECQREIYNTWKKYCPNKLCVYLKTVYTQADLTNKINYVLGIKSEPEKHPLVEADRVWRQQVGLEQFYRSNNFKMMVAEQNEV